MNFSYKIAQHGFTLIELLVVISIIGLLSSVVLANLNGAREKAKLSKALQTMVEVNKIAFVCSTEGSVLTSPSFSGVGGTLVCPAETATLPNISDTGFVYCGGLCGGWDSTGTGAYAFSAFSDSFSGGRKIIVCGSDMNKTGWYYPGSPFNLTGINGCKKDGF